MNKHAFNKLTMAWLVRKYSKFSFKAAEINEKLKISLGFDVESFYKLIFGIFAIERLTNVHGVQLSPKPRVKYLNVVSDF